MTELEKEIRKYLKKTFHHEYYDDVVKVMGFAEPREKQIAELTEQNTSLLTSVENLNKSVQELEAQIEKMKRCEICKYGGTYLPVCHSNEPCKNKDKFELRR